MIYYSDGVFPAWGFIIMFIFIYIAIKEYKQFENKYYNQNVEFCLLCDIESGLIKPTNIIEKGKYIIVFE